MFDVPYEKMVCDSDLGDGGLYFYNEYMEWVLRNSNSGFKIYYKEAKRGKHVAQNFVYYLNLQTCKNVIREQLELLNSIKEINGTPTLEMWYNSYHQK